jgi:hypothetical protein
MKFYPTEKAKNLNQLTDNVWDALDALPGDQTIDLQMEDITDNEDTRDAAYICCVLNDDGSVKTEELSDPTITYVTRGLIETR